MHMLRLYRYLLDISSIVLLITIYLYILTGYGMVRGEHILLPLSYEASVKLHLNQLLRLALILSTAIHGVTGFTIICYRVVRNTMYQYIAVSIIHTFFLGFTIYLLILEFS